MANQKAQRQQVEFPPLLNLQDDRPRIATDFRSVEHINAPYLNGMMMPLWKKEESYTNKPVWDYKDNKYEIRDGYLTKNGENLFAVDDYHFEKEDVTEEYSKYLAFNFSNEGDLAHLDWSTESNTVDFYYKTYHLSKIALFTNGVLLASRVRVFDANTAIAVVVYEVESKHYILYMNTANNTVYSEEIVWCTFKPKTNTAETMASKVESISIPQVSPIIYIANPLSGQYAVSLVSNKNAILYTRTNGYYTLYDKGAEASPRYLSGTNWISTDGSASEVITQYYMSNFQFAWQYSFIRTLIRCIQKADTKWYYADDPTTELPNQDSIHFSPYASSETIEIEGVTYTVYLQQSYENRFKAIVSADDLYGQNADISIVLTPDESTITGTLTPSAPLEIDYITNDYYQKKSAFESAQITYYGSTYDVTDFKKQYTVTRSDTSLSTLAYLNCPQVFLDNGNLYSFYTIPQAAANSWYALPQTAFLVESGILTGFSGNAYTFSIIEAHATSAYAFIGRSNSIGCGQNFWTSETKLSNDGVRKPSELYDLSSPLAEIAPSAGHSYTDYSNSNATDMLYYPGITTAEDMPFYPNASEGAEDWAYYNPGGFRTPVQNGSKWNILYYVAEDAVDIQGISYSKDENEMGVLLTPFAAISLDGYIACADDFIVYFDKNNRIYKISIEEGAQVRQLFDNKYILVNTTSYWNLWDEEHNRKFHYATDYNNRIKIGLDRVTYRASNSTFFTERKVRKFASIINYNYNAVPRYPIISMAPVVFSLFHSLDAEDMILNNLHAYGCDYDEAREVQPIEIYYQYGPATNKVAKYLASVKVFPNGLNIFRDPNLDPIDYSSTSSDVYPVCLFATFINGAGNNDFVVEDYSKYPLIYNNQTQPTLVYNHAGGASVENAKWFFVIQGQYYSVIGNKLYAMIYSSGVISQMDAIVDIRDMKYVGNTPAIAFFVNPYTKQVYSFTGDANLQQIFDASKFTFTWNDKKPDELNHWYDESTQSIYIATEQGLLVFGPQNTYCLEDFKNVSDIEFVDGNIHIVEDKVTTLRYYHDIEDFTDLPIYLETSFWGLGSDESTSIDRWQITLYDPEHREQDVKFQVRSLTDVSTQAEEKKLHIDKSDWDKWSHSVLLSFSPKLIKGQGIRLSIKTDSAIQKIVPHIMDNNAGVITRGKFEV